MMKKTLSVLIALAMILSAAPAAFAADQWETDIDVFGVATANGKSYNTVQDAVDAANGGVVTLTQDSQETVTVSGDLYLDLNGKTLTALNITEGTLYGMDSTTDDYDCSNGYGKIVTLTGTFAKEHKTDITGSIRRYIGVNEADGVSFHRFYLSVTKVNLRPATTGFGYKAEFYGDAKAQSELSAIGYSLSLGGGKAVTRNTNSFKNTLTLSLQNFDVANHGETSVNASATATLTDGTVIVSAVASYSMREIVEIVNTNFSSYNNTQKQAVQAMCNHYNTVMADWNISDILTWAE